MWLVIFIMKNLLEFECGPPFFSPDVITSANIFITYNDMSL